MQMERSRFLYVSRWLLPHSQAVEQDGFTNFEVVLK